MFPVKGALAAFSVLEFPRFLIYGDVDFNISGDKPKFSLLVHFRIRPSLRLLAEW